MFTLQASLSLLFIHNPLFLSLNESQKEKKIYCLNTIYIFLCFRVGLGAFDNPDRDDITETIRAVVEKVGFFFLAYPMENFCLTDWGNKLSSYIDVIGRGAGGIRWLVQHCWHHLERLLISVFYVIFGQTFWHRHRPQQLLLEFKSVA